MSKTFLNANRIYTDCGKMSEKEEQPLKIYLRLSGEGADRFQRIKEAMGLKNDTEVIRSLITWYWKTHEDELIPQLHYVNADEEGVKILDRKIPEVVQVHITRKGVKCSYCKTNNCRHIKYALNQPDVQKTITKKRKEGWNLP